MYIARQPIFNKSLKVYGYELLFRGETTSAGFDASSGQQATHAVLAGFYENGMRAITDDKVAFINFGSFIKDINIEKIFSPEHIVIEILEDTVCDDDLKATLCRLRELGYNIALDDFVDDIKAYDLVEFATLIKFDLLQTPVSDLHEQVKEAHRRGIFCLAEKVENEEQFDQAKQAGFDFYQGYFFSRPKIVGGRREHIKSSAKMYQQILDELHADEPSLRRVSDLIKVNVDISYKLMRMMRNRSDEVDVSTIQRALAYMGLKEINRWIYVLILADAGKGKPAELFRLSVMRSVFAEKIASLSNQPQLKNKASMMGLFSVLDAMTDLPMAQALEDIVLQKDIVDALVKQQGELYLILFLIIHYERGNWGNIVEVINYFHIQPNELYQAYYESVMVAREILGSLSIG